MSYVVSGHVRGLGAVSVEISQRAERPREEMRPSPAKSTSSTMMATRALRPREPAPPATMNFLSKVSSYKGQQAELERVLKALGDDLNVAKNKYRKYSEANDRVGKTEMKLQVARIESAVSQCVSMIKECAAKANVAADSAIAQGATRSEVKEAAAAPVAKGETVAVESTTVHVTPSGQVVPGPDANVVVTPTLAEPGNVPVKVQDVTVSSGTIGTVALVGAAAVLGYFMLKKKGHA